MDRKKKGPSRGGARSRRGEEGSMPGMRTQDETHIDWPRTPMFRKNTDSFALLIFVGFVLIWLLVGSSGRLKDNVETITNPTNSEGDICGVGEYEGLPYLLYLDYRQCAEADSLGFCATRQVCVKECPEDDFFPLFAREGYVLWETFNEANFAPPMSSEREILDKVAPFCAPEVYRTSDQYSRSLVELIDLNLCPLFWLKSKPFMNRCLPVHFNMTGGVTPPEGVTVASPNVSVATPLSLFFRETPQGLSQDHDDDEDFTVARFARASMALESNFKSRNFLHRLVDDVLASWHILMVGTVCTLLVALGCGFCVTTCPEFMMAAALLTIVAVLGWAMALSFHQFLDLMGDEGRREHFNALYGLPVSAWSSVILGMPETWIVALVACAALLTATLALTFKTRSRLPAASRALRLAGASVRDTCATGGGGDAQLYAILTFGLQCLVFGWFYFSGVTVASSERPTFATNTLGCTTDRDVRRLRRFCFDTAADALQPIFGNASDVRVAADCRPTSFRCPSCARCQFRQYDHQATHVLMEVYNLLGIAWVSTFIGDFNTLVLARTLAMSSFSADGESWPLLGSMVKSARYHAGTVALGSLHRLVVPVLDALLFLPRPLAGALAKNAIVMTALFGTDYANSVKLVRSFSSGAAAKGALDLYDTCRLVALLIKSAITSLNLLFFHSLLTGDFRVVFAVPYDRLNYVHVPVAISAICAWITAELILNVYLTNLGTVLICYLVETSDDEATVRCPVCPAAIKRLLPPLQGQSRRSRSRSSAGTRGSQDQPRQVIG